MNTFVGVSHLAVGRLACPFRVGSAVGLAISRLANSTELEETKQ